MLPGATSGAVEITKEVMEVLAPKLKTPSIRTEVEVPIPIPEAVSTRKEKEPLAAVTSLLTLRRRRSRLPSLFEKPWYKVRDRPLVPVSEATVTESLAPVSGSMVTDQ